MFGWPPDMHKISVPQFQYLSICLTVARIHAVRARLEAILTGTSLVAEFPHKLIITPQARSFLNTSLSSKFMKMRALQQYHGVVSLSVYS
jgi:hypothetical protein